MQEGLKPKQNKKGFLKSSLFFAWDIIKIIVISLAIIIPVLYFLIQTFFVNGASMEPQFHDGEYLIIDELSYRFNKPQRGEVIVFKYPKDPSQYYIKRIIGIPNEKIKIDQGKIIIFNEQNPNGFILNENDYLSVEEGGTFLLETKLGKREYFVLGDNRQASSDSRVWGPLPKNFIVGRAWIRAWPFDKIDIFGKPEY